MADDAPSTDAPRSERDDDKSPRSGPDARDGADDASDGAAVPSETAGRFASNDRVDDGVEALEEPDVRRAVIGNAGAFAGAGIGLGCIVLVSLFRLVGAEFTDPESIVGSVFAVSEVYLVLTAVAAVGVTNYVLLAGLIGIDSGGRFDTDAHAMAAAGVGSAIGACILLVALAIATAIGFLALSSVTPPLEELSRMADIARSTGGVSGVGAAGPGGAEASGEAGLSALEVLGALLSLVVTGAVIAALAGVTGSVTAYVTRRYGLA